MKNFFVCILTLIIQSAAAQKVLLLSEITENERTVLINRYAEDDTDQKNQQLLYQTRQ